MGKVHVRYTIRCIFRRRKSKSGPVIVCSLAERIKFDREDFTQMSAEITMPQLSDTMTDGKVVKWHKKEGDRVAAGEEIADIETDKAVMPMEAFESGTLAVIAVAEGQSAPVGAVLGVIATGKENAADVKKNFKPAASGERRTAESGGGENRSRCIRKAASGACAKPAITFERADQRLRFRRGTTQALRL